MPTSIPHLHGKAEVNSFVCKSRKALCWPPNTQPINVDLPDGWIRVLRIVNTSVSGILRLERRLHKLGSRKAYTAISYVWGNNRRCHRIYVDGAPSLIRQNLWDCLQSIQMSQLQEKSKADGRYLRMAQRCFFVDAICIRQDDIEEKNRQVSQMGRIFGGAEQVWAWLGPGFGLMLREVQQMLEGAEPEDLTLRERVHERLAQASSYWNRTWIIQECVLSQRLLLFSDGIFWEFSEVVHWMAVKDRFPSSKIASLKSLIAQDRMEYDLIRAVCEFRGAECTDSRDQIYAIQSLVNPVSRCSVDYTIDTCTLFWQVVAVSFLARPRRESTRWRVTFDECQKLASALQITIAEAVSSCHTASKISTAANPEYIVLGSFRHPQEQSRVVDLVPGKGLITNACDRCYRLINGTASPCNYLFGWTNLHEYLHEPVYMILQGSDNGSESPKFRGIVKQIEHANYTDSRGIIDCVRAADLAEPLLGQTSVDGCDLSVDDYAANAQTLQARDRDSEVIQDHGGDADEERKRFRAAQDERVERQLGVGDHDDKSKARGYYLCLIAQAIAAADDMAANELICKLETDNLVKPRVDVYASPALLAMALAMLDRKNWSNYTTELRLRISRYESLLSDGVLTKFGQLTSNDEDWAGTDHHNICSRPECKRDNPAWMPFPRPEAWWEGYSDSE